MYGIFGAERKAQISVEYIIIISVLLLFFIPVLYYSNVQRINFVNTYALSQSDISLNRLATVADYVYYLGEGNEIVVEAYFPTQLTGYGITGNGYELSAMLGDTEMVKTTRARLLLTNVGPVITEGRHRFLIRYGRTANGVEILAA